MQLQQHPSQSSGRKSISPKTKAIVMVACTLLLCLVITLNAVYETPLFILGLNFIYDYQKNQPYTFLHFLQNLISLVCNPIGISAVLIVYYIGNNRKLLLLVHLSYFFLATYLMALLKQSFQQSRPIWVNPQIQKWEWFCPTDFGNPSGHSFAVSMLYEPIISDVIGYGRRKLWALVLLFFCIMVPISRMYLGVHSANQIFFGLTLGLIFLVLYKFVYQKYLYFLFWSMLMKHEKVKKLAITIILNVIALVVPIIFYEVNVANRPIPESDIHNLNETCGKNLTGKEIQGKMLTACSVFSFFFGIVYGFVLLMNTPGFRKYLLGLWRFENMNKRIKKIGIYILSAGVPALFFYILSMLSHNPILKYFLLSLTTLVFGFGLSFVAPILTHKWNIMTFLPGSATEYEDKLDEIN